MLILSSKTKQHQLQWSHPVPNLVGMDAVIRIRCSSSLWVTLLELIVWQDISAFMESVVATTILVRVVYNTICN
jgi:hypothetical protein